MDMDLCLCLQQTLLTFVSGDNVVGAVDSPDAGDTFVDRKSVNT